MKYYDPVFEVGIEMILFMALLAFWPFYRVTEGTVCRLWLQLVTC